MRTNIAVVSKRGIPQIHTNLKQAFKHAKQNNGVLFRYDLKMPDTIVEGICVPFAGQILRNFA